MKLIIDFDQLDEEKLVNCLKKHLGVEGSLDEILKKLSESFDLYVTELPLPKNSDLLKKMKGFRINPSKKCDEKVLSKIVNFCKPIESFKIVEIHECNGIRIIFDDLEEIYVLETNVDDVSGEFISYAVEEILKDALDVYVYPYVGKKGRIGYMIKVLCKDNFSELAEKMCKSLPTLGVRIYSVSRYKVKRKIIERTVNVFGKEFKVRVKVSEVSVKPEFEDIKEIAKSLNKPLSVVYREVLRGLKDEDFNWK